MAEKTKDITGAELVARTLKALGVTTVFGLTGMYGTEIDFECPESKDHTTN